MKAIILEQPGSIENLKLTELERPPIGNDEVLVEVKAISINPVDVKTRAGKGMYARLKDEHPLIIGWDISGVVVDAGKEVSTFKKGDEVFGMVNFPGHGKAYAQFNAAPASHLAKKPSNISHQEAAASTLAAVTAWQALVTHAAIQKGQKILIHAASGGVGHFAVQIARHLGAYVIGTSSAENKDLVVGLGANEHVDYKAHPFEKAVIDADFVLETVGGDNINRSIDALKKGGSVISILGNGTEATAKKAGQKGVSIRSFLVQSNQADIITIAELLEKGIIKPHVSLTFPFEKMGEAHLSVETGRTKGKVIITL